MNPAPNIGQDSLVDRFRSLAGVAEPQSHSGPGSEHDEDDGKTVEDLLAEIGPDDQWTQNPEEPNEMRKLLDEARKALLQVEEHPLNKDSEELSQSSGQSKPVAQLPSPGPRSPTLDEEPEVSPIQTEDEEAAIYLQQILDELQLDEQSEPIEEPSYDNEDGKSEHSLSRSLHTVDLGLPGLNMPSVPTSVPLSPHQSTDDDTVLTLVLPSTPNTAPRRKSTSQSVNTKMPQYSDRDIETWCVICNDDATVRCLGCEGDLYCAKCWKEGHMGKEVGYDEKTHRWVKYKQR